MPFVATNDLHYTSPEDAKAHSALLCVQSGSTMMDPNRFKFDADDFYLKSPAEMRHTWRELPEACDNTLRIAEMCEISFTEDEGRYMPRFPCPPGRERGELVRQGGRSAACASASPAASPTTRSKQAEFETEVIVSQGVPGYFLVVADFINWAKSNGIRVGPGRGSGAGLDVRLRHEDHRPRPDPARADLRAVPQPRATLAARLRRRLRRAPARRGDPLRHREVRQRAGRADRHLRHHQGQAGRQGRRPGHGPPVRGRRAADQGDAARRHGQGRAAVGHLRPHLPALRRGQGVPRPGRHRAAPAGGRRDRQGPRGAQAPVGRARRRRHHEQRAAHRRHPDHAPAAGRPGHHPVRLPELRGARPGQDGLPRAAQPHHPRRRHRQREEQPRRGHRPRRAVART